jgi:hypothetical protein
MSIEIRRLLYKNSDLFRKNKVKLANILTVTQIGGNKRLSVNYNDNKYIFEESNIDENHYILYSLEEEDCIVVIISKEDKTAEIHSIGNYNTCIRDTNRNIGSNLLKLTLKMLKKYKDKLEINLIILADNSIKKCGNTDINLAFMMTLLTGDTWYGKYSFRPISIENNKYTLDKLLNKAYNKNKKIMEKITISDTELIKYIKKTNNNNLINSIAKIINEYPTMLLKVYLSNLLSNYDKTCDDFSKFYVKLYTKIGLYDLHRKLFGLFL